MAIRSTLKIKSKNKFGKWGYIFLIPFALTYLIFTFYPLMSTFYYSFFEMYSDGLEVIGPNFVKLDNYKEVLKGDTLKYFANTGIVWIIGFIPQILIALLLASWFTNMRLKLKGTGFFKVIIYMPNMIMASSLAMLFFSIFSNSENGPINLLLQSLGFEPVRFLFDTWWSRGIVASMNWLLWYGNSTIILMAGIMGIDTYLYESAQLDGAGSFKMFTKITLPLLKPILLFVLITSLIGGLQMFDVPQIWTDGEGNPNRTTMTIIMNLNHHLRCDNYGIGGAISVLVFIVGAIFSLIIFRFNTSKYDRMLKRRERK